MWNKIYTVYKSSLATRKSRTPWTVAYYFPSPYTFAEPLIGLHLHTSDSENINCIKYIFINSYVSYNFFTLISSHFLSVDVAWFLFTSVPLFYPCLYVFVCFFSFRCDRRNFNATCSGSTTLTLRLPKGIAYRSTGKLVSVTHKHAIAYDKHKLAGLWRQCRVPPRTKSTLRWSRSE